MGLELRVLAGELAELLAQRFVGLRGLLLHRLLNSTPLLGLEVYGRLHSSVLPLVKIKA